MKFPTVQDQPGDVAMSGEEGVFNAARAAIRAQTQDGGLSLRSTRYRSSPAFGYVAVAEFVGGKPDMPIYVVAWSSGTTDEAAKVFWTYDGGSIGHGDRPGSPLAFGRLLPDGSPHEPCCEDLFLHSLSPLSDPDLVEAMEASGESLPEPIVDFVPTYGIYAIGGVDISFCPWCGTRLPEPAP